MQYVITDSFNKISCMPLSCFMAKPQNLKTFAAFLGAVLIKCHSNIKVREWASTKSSLLLQEAGRDTNKKGHAFRDYRLPCW